MKIILPTGYTQDDTQGPTGLAGSGTTGAAGTDRRSLFGFHQKGSSPYEVYYCAGMWGQGGATTNTGTSWTANLLRALPVFTEQVITIDQYAMWHATTTTGNFKIGFYTTTSTSNPYPNALVAGSEFTIAIGSTNGALYTVSVSPSLVLQPGLYWMAGVLDSAQSGKVVTAGTASPILLGFDSTFTEANSNAIGWRASHTYGALPDPFPASASLLRYGLENYMPLFAYRLTTD